MDLRMSANQVMPRAVQPASAAIDGMVKVDGLDCR
jgi:hypothetical protein